MSVDNQDLQTYLDSFNKEIEEGTDTSFVTLPADSANPDPMNGDEVAQRILREFNDGLEEDDVAAAEEEDGTYFVDQAGNYYFQSSKDAEPPTPIKLYKGTKKEPALTITTRSSTAKRAAQIPTNISKVVKEEDATMDYVLIGDDKSDDQQSVAEDDNDDPDDPNYDGKQVFDFNEAAEGSTEDGASTSLLQSRNPIRVKSNAKNQDPKAEIISCQHCKYTTKKRFLLARHMRSHSDVRPYKCAVCERGFKTHSSLLNHVNVHLGNKPHACKSCDMSFTTSGEMVRHTRYKHTGEKPHKCTECDYCSVELSKLRRHIRCHTGERPYQCPHCTYASPDTFKLKRHLRTHTGEKPYECEICQARFTQSNSLKAHRLIHSVADKPIFQCGLCPTTCGRKNDLRMHVQKIHHSDKPINCKRCGKDLPDRYAYKMHMKTHEGEKCYRCELCAYASISVRHLESHMLIHTDQKPFACEFCTMSFRQRQLLKRHLNLHHNSDYQAPSPREKAHSCPHCKCAFTHKGNLMRHMEMHDPESRMQREKLKLKIGRMTRVQADGSVSTIGTGKLYGLDDESTNNEGDENLEQASTEEDYEIIETIDVADEVADRKPTISETFAEVAESGDLMPDTVCIKNEALLAVEGDDGEEEYMVLEVMQTDDDEDDEDDDENGVASERAGAVSMEMLINTNTNASTSKAPGVDNCFGFEEDEEEFDEKETIHLLDIDEDD